MSDSSAAAVTLFVMMYCATILARVTIELSTSLSVHLVELVYRNNMFQNFSHMEIKNCVQTGLYANENEQLLQVSS